ncbi:MAG: family intrarane metalloprotease [Gammaproteobacteria bacterium]|nr:family intrarane metalloprotease [Gammaproteobacteria bacterium]
MTPKVQLRDIFLLMIGAIIAEIVIVVPLQMFRPSLFLTVTTTVMVGSVWWIVGYQRLSHIRGWESLQARFSPVAGRIILASVLGGLVLILLPWGLAEILELAGIKIADIPAQAGLPSNLRQLPLALVGVVVLGPLSEELIFRGLLLDWLKQRMAVWPAALIISLLFAFLHNVSFKNVIIGWIGFLVRFLLGVGASFFTIRYRSLRASFVMHATLNGCACLAGVLRGGT